MSSSTKRQSILPRVQSGPKAPANLSSSVTIADSALLIGTHTINVSSESVIHPRAKLDSANGRITIGRRCIVHERTNIGALSADPTPSESRDGVVVGDYVTIEVGAVIESGGTMIGDGCHVGVGSRIGKGAKLGKVS
jgi:dynactin 6